MPKPTGFRWAWQESHTQYWTRRSGSIAYGLYPKGYGERKLRPSDGLCVI